ncbi:MAG: low molecular weight phosphotyrosine protein phosphatase [Gammaproteobacteria bacterium]|nr:low molecular weight phosphotyrosine protein phosphatase [Gammaproteobacteria bacterium]
MIKVLFVCMGNICRSPTAEGVFRHIVEQAELGDKIHIDSGGTHAYHVGNEPDQRAQATALKRGLDLSNQRARKVKTSDFEEFDYILAMDASNYAELENICPRGEENRLSLFLEFANGVREREVPDPYYGGDQGFEHVFDLVENASRGLLEDIRSKHKI